MAIHTSPGCCSSSSSSLAYLHRLRKSDKFTLFSNFKSYPFPFPFSQSFVIANSSASPSPILEERETAASFAPLPVVEFSYEAENANPQNSGRTQVRNFNKFVRELLRNPKTQELAIEFYEKAKENIGFQPQKSTVKSLLMFLLGSKKWDLISLVSKDLKKYLVFPDEVTCARLISVCIRARKFRVAEMLLEAFECDADGNIAVSAFDAAVRGYNKLHMYSSTIVVYARMKSADIQLDPGGYPPIMEAYMKVGNSNKVVELFNELESGGKLVSNPLSTQVYSILVEALGKSGQAFKALEYFKAMVRNGISPNASIYSSLIGSFADIREAEAADELTREAEEKQMLKDPAVFLKLVLMYVDKGLVEKSSDVVKKMQSANLKVSDCIFCAIVNGFAKKRSLKSAAKVYEEFISQGTEPGQVTYASVLNIYCRLGLYSSAEKIFEEMTQRGFDKCVVAYSSMIVTYGKIGKLKEAMKLVAKMKEKGCEPNVWIYNALIDLHGRAKNLRRVEKLWKEMKRRKVAPDRVTYTSIISAYSKAREYEQSVHFYHEFRLNGGVVDRAMAGIMVGVFSKINRIDELVKLLQDMKAEGTILDARLYRSASNALRDAGLDLQAKWLKESFDNTFLVSGTGINANGRPQRIAVLQ
ncbi:hypothetical protein Ancab_009095 [Ancistrocladus abbreviatus]